MNSKSLVALVEYMKYRQASLSFQAFAILMLVYEKGPMTRSQIADELQYSESGIEKHLYDLVSKKGKTNHSLEFLKYSSVTRLLSLTVEGQGYITQIAKAS